MSNSIMPVFEKYLDEAAIIGRLLTSYGELEFELCLTLAEVLQCRDTAIRIMYRNRGEDHRINITDALMRPKFSTLNMDSFYCEVVAGMRHCRKIRNQFAHCHFVDEAEFIEGKNCLFFIALEEEAKKSTPIVSLTKYRLDTTLLKSHETYFSFVQNGWLHLKHEYVARTNASGEKNPFPKPAIIPQPPLYKSL